MTDRWFVPTPPWISEVALLLVVAGIAWLGHALAWRLAPAADAGARGQRYRAPTRLLVIMIALLAVPAVIGPVGSGSLPWMHLALLGLIASVGWLVHAALPRGGWLLVVPVALATLAAALITLPVFDRLSTLLLAVAAVLALLIAVALGRRVG